MEANQQNEWAEASGAAEISIAEMENLVNEYNRTWDEYQAAKDHASELHDVFQKVEHTIIKKLQSAHKTSYKSEVGLVSIAVAASVTVPKTTEEKKALFAYLNELGEDVFYGMASVASQTLNSWYKKMKEEAGHPPGFSIPGVGEASERVTLKFKPAAKP